MYKTVSIDDSEDFLGHTTDNGASLTGYYKADSLKKIVEWIGLSNKVIQNEYYMDSGNLIFVYSTESSYRFNDSIKSFDYPKLYPVYKGRYYFHNGKLINTLFTDKKHSITKQEDAASFLTLAKKYVKQLNSKRK